MATNNGSLQDLASEPQQPSILEAPSAPSTWSGLFKKKTEQQLSFHAQVKGAGNSIVTIPQEAVEEGIKRWENCLVGWFIGETPEFRMVVSAINKMWGKKSRVNVAKKGKLFIMQFTDLKLMQWVMENGPWFIGKNLFVVQRWHHSLSGGSINLKTIPLWFIFRNIPMHLYNNTCLSYIASAIGKPLYMDRGTQSQSHLDFARICIEVDFDDAIPTVLKVNAGDGHLVEIPVVVPWMPHKCCLCRVFGHDCTMKKQEGKDLNSIQGIEEAAESSSTDQDQSHSPNSVEEDLKVTENAPGGIPAKCESAEASERSENVEGKICSSDLTPISPPCKARTPLDDDYEVATSKTAELNKLSSDVKTGKSTQITEAPKKKKSKKRGKGLIAPTSPS